MSDPEARELRGVCEALRSALCSTMRVSRFRLDVVCRGAPQRSIELPERDVLHGSLRRPALRRAAVMTAPVRDGAGLVASVTIEDDSVAFLPAAAREQVERVAALYAPMLRACLRAGGSWPQQNRQPRLSAPAGMVERGRFSGRRPR